MFTLFRRRLTSLLVLTHIQPSCSLRTFCLRRWDVSTARLIFSHRPRSTTNEQRDSSSKSFVSVHQLNNRLCKRFAELSQLAGNIECIDQLMDLLRTQNSMEEILNLINQVTSPLVHTRIAELLHTLLNVSFNFQRNKRFNQTEISLKQTNQQRFSYWIVEHRSAELRRDDFPQTWDSNEVSHEHSERPSSLVDVHTKTTSDAEEELVSPEFSLLFADVDHRSVVNRSPIRIVVLVVRLDVLPTILERSRTTRSCWTVSKPNEKDHRHFLGLVIQWYSQYAISGVSND